MLFVIGALLSGVSLIVFFVLWIIKEIVPPEFGLYIFRTINRILAVALLIGAVVIMVSVVQAP